MVKQLYADVIRLFDDDLERNAFKYCMIKTSDYLNWCYEVSLSEEWNELSLDVRTRYYNRLDQMYYLTILRTN